MAMPAESIFPFFVCPVFLALPSTAPDRRSARSCRGKPSQRAAVATPDGPSSGIRTADQGCPRARGCQRARPSHGRPTCSGTPATAAAASPPPPLFAFGVPSAPSRARAPFCVRRECARGGRRVGPRHTRPTVHRVDRPAGCHGQRRPGTPATKAPCVSRPSKGHKQEGYDCTPAGNTKRRRQRRNKTRNPRSRSVRHAPRPETR